MAAVSVHLEPEDVSPADAGRLTAQLVTQDTMTVGEVTVPLGPRARAVLGQIFGFLAAGTSVDVVPVTEWLTTSGAASMLHVSRPTLVQMLESGLIAYDQPGVHRRVSRAAVDAFLTERRERRQTALDELAQAEDPAVADEFVETR